MGESNLRSTPLHTFLPHPGFIIDFQGGHEIVCFTSFPTVCLNLSHSSWEGLGNKETDSLPNHISWVISVGLQGCTSGQNSDHSTWFWMELLCTPCYCIAMEVGGKPLGQLYFVPDTSA